MKILTFPPNCTSVNQPTDTGVISTIKAYYRREILLDILTDFEMRHNRRAIVIQDKFKSGMTEINEGPDSHLLEVAEIIQKSWSLVSERKIARC